MQHSLEIIDLNLLEMNQRAAALLTLGRLYSKEWGHCDSSYGTPSQATNNAKRRSESSDQVIFVALLGKELIGTASVGWDDYYPGFLSQNKVAGMPVLRDVLVVDKYRGEMFGGLRASEHLVRNTLQWVEQRGFLELGAFVENGTPLGPALDRNRALRAKVDPQGYRSRFNSDVPCQLQARYREPARQAIIFDIGVCKYGVRKARYCGLFYLVRSNS